MYFDDDVVLHPQCIATLVGHLSRRPVYAALAADYLDEYRQVRSPTTSRWVRPCFVGTFSRQLQFTWNDKQCECQCCCDDLRSRHLAIDYCPSAKARHLRYGDRRHGRPQHAAACPNKLFDQTSQLCRSEWLCIPSICLVVCYFGPLPGWIRHYLLSCAFNPSIHFLIVTDQTDLPSLPPNVRVEQLSSSAFSNRASAKTGIQVDLQHARKLCDFKPIYGHLFEELLDGFDYWGYADLDVIYGDIRRFLAAVRIHTYDMYTAREEFLVGHFTLLRNRPRMRTLYQESTDWRATLQSPKILGFDECGWQWARRMQGKPLIRDGACDSMTHVVHRLMDRQEISACFTSAVVELPGLAGSDWRLQWRAGQLWAEQREVMYAHFHTLKRRPGYQHPDPVDSDSTLEMTPQGLFTR